MSLQSIMGMATGALSVNQQALRTTSNNIANVNTPGYVRQRVDLQARTAGTQNNGVEIAGINRAVDKFLEAASWTARAEYSQYDVQANYYQRFETILGDPNKNNSIPGKLDQLYSSLTNLALDPTAAGNRQSALSAIDAFGRTISETADEIQNLRSEVSQQISGVVDQINTALKRIEDLNPQIVGEKSLGGDAASLEEQRSAALADLSEYLDIKVNTNADGSVRVTTGNGTSLVDITAYQLKYNPPATITSGTLFESITIHPVEGNTGAVSPVGQPLDGNIQGGELRGLLDMRDNILPDFAEELGALSRTAVDQFNAIHNANTAYPAPNNLTGVQTGMLASDENGFTGQSHFSVLNADGTVVNTVNIDFDSYPPGTPLSTIIADVNTGLGGDGTLSLTSGVMSFTATNPAHGVAIVQDDVVPSDRGGRGFSHFFGMNDLMKSDTPSHYDTGFVPGDNHNLTPGGTLNLQLRSPSGNIAVDYTYTVGGTTFTDVLNDLNSSPLSTYMTFSMDADGALQATPAPGTEDFELFSVSDSTDRGGTGTTLSRLFGIGEAYAANAANGVGVADAVANNNQRLATAQYDLSAAPGDPVITIGDGRGATALVDLQNTRTQFDAVGRLNSMSATLSQYGAAFLSNAGLAASSAMTRRDDSEALTTAIDEKLANTTGVNLDEELSNLLVYQNAYNAAARIVTTAQEMMDTLIGMMR